MDLRAARDAQASLEAVDEEVRTDPSSRTIATPARIPTPHYRVVDLIKSTLGVYGVRVRCSLHRMRNGMLAFVWFQGGSGMSADPLAGTIVRRSRQQRLLVGVNGEAGDEKTCPDTGAVDGLGGAAGPCRRSAAEDAGDAEPGGSGEVGRIAAG